MNKINRLFDRFEDAIGIPVEKQQCQSKVALRRPDHNYFNSDYNIEFLNTKCNLPEILDGLRLYRQGRLCFYGPPGSGKTEFGRYLAHELQMPLMVRDATSIISPYVGQSETNIANIFREASHAGAILILDEADSYFQNRQLANRSWEISGVNQMLTSLESFEGIFIASTNLMETFDSAALRRFDMKIEFGYLKPEQTWSLFIQTLTNLNLDTVSAAIHKNAVRSIDNLTPGDFSVILRQSRLQRINSADELIKRIKEESNAKNYGVNSRIGF